MCVNSLTAGIYALRCNLCRNGLLTDYDVYRREEDEHGVPGAPVLVEVTSGYLYSKSVRHLAEILEIAGDIAGGTRHGLRLLAFDGNAEVDDLIDVAGVFYRVSHVADVLSLCRILDLEADGYAAAA